MNTLSKIGMLCMVCFLCLCGCSTQKENMDTPKERMDQMKEDTKETMDDIMNYFKEKKVEFENVQTIDQSTFAAYEGRSFDVDGKTVYLYRINRNDPHMMNVIEDIEDDQKLMVRIREEEKEYMALLNGNYILLYDPTTDMQDIVSIYQMYQKETPKPIDTNQKNAKDPINTQTSDGASGNAKTNDRNVANTTTGNQNVEVEEQVDE